MEIKHDYKTKKYTSWINMCKYILVHHTGGTKKSDIDLLCYSDATVSCHYYVDYSWNIYMFASHDKITRHAWETRHELKNHNSIGIEVESRDGKTYTREQRQSVARLVRDIMEKEQISVSNVLRHADVASYRGKWDIWPDFYKEEWTRDEWKRKNLLSFEMTDFEKKLIPVIIKIMKWRWHKYPQIRSNCHNIANDMREIWSLAGIDKEQLQ